jgi:hypothetical protein
MPLRSSPPLRAAAAAALLLLGACGRGDAPPATAGGGGDPPAADTAPPRPAPDPAVVRQHADALDAASARIRAHVHDMRGLLPAEWRAAMDEHVREVDAFLATADRAMEALDVPAAAHDDRVGALMGTTADEHRRMMDDMAALRAEAQELRGATVDELRDRMAPHLSRLARFADQLERAAEHMRSG